MPAGTVTGKFAATALGTSGGCGDATCAVCQPLAGMNRGPAGVFARWYGRVAVLDGADDPAHAATNPAISKTAQVQVIRRLLMVSV
jgi:hypothetical protein